MDDFSQYPILFVVAIIIGWLASVTFFKAWHQQENESAAILAEWGGWRALLAGFGIDISYAAALAMSLPYPPLFLTLVGYLGIGLWMTRHWRFKSKGAWLLRMALALLWPLHRGRRK
ncbi:hypothetical protein AB6Q56_08425 [Dechloromonas sp. ARDL1]|uniref:hypothetical protein n=1 Tax=Dechloromonas sp. ARDL1 TaxID=3322121 RepID=UPI003DA76D8D